MQPYPLRALTIFTVAFATLAFQILISRVLSVTMYYHFAFAGVTLAMLGLTAGALKVFLNPQRFSAGNAHAEIARHALYFAVCLVLTVLLHISGWLLKMTWGMSLLVSAILCVYAFIYSSICITLLLTRFPLDTAKLYAFDLIGAALGCIALIFALMWLDPISIVFALGALLALIGSINAACAATPDIRRMAGAVCVVLLFLTLTQATSVLQEKPLFRVTWAKSGDLPLPEFERWNTYSRVAVFGYKDEAGSPPFGWGFGHPQTTNIPQKILNIDADAATILTRFDGNLGRLSYLKNDIINLGYHVARPRDIAIIGVGGGRDILSALVFGATSIHGIEMNPAIFEALSDRFGEFTGHLDRIPAVRLINAEARSHLAASPDHYDLIQISLIDTWATTAAGGLTLSENKLYTTDAWRQFLDVLSPEGVLAVSRWFDPKTHIGEFYRLVAIAAEAVHERSPQADPRRHILAASVGRIITVLVSPTPFSAQAVARFHEACKREGFHVMLSPESAFDETVATIASYRADRAFFDNIPLDVSPTTDDRPFFFQMLKTKDFWNLGHFVASYNTQNNLGMSVLIFVFGIVTAVSAMYCARPLLVLWKRGQKPPPLSHLGYFAAIGAGFMLIEMAQMQRLMIFLGHPVYGLSVVLFSLLLFSGLGSASVDRMRRDRKNIMLRLYVLLALLVLTGLLTPTVVQLAQDLGVMPRIVISVAMLALIGFFMGMPLSMGIAMHSQRSVEFLPWFWGINGMFSVFSSVGAVILSLMYGITVTYWIGVAAYVACTLFTAASLRSNQVSTKD